VTTSIGGSYPAVNSDSDATINGLTVGKGGGSQATNTLLGNGSLTTASAGLRITAVGASVLTASTGNNNTGVGYLASGGNTTGYSNTATGSYALGLNLIGNNNTAVGSVSLYNNTADNNTAVGYQSLYANTTGTNNVSVGYNSLYTKTTGSYNVAVGIQAGFNMTTGQRNTLIGTTAGSNLTTGSYNTFIGSLDSTGGNAAGAAITTGSNNTILGNYTGNQGGLDIRTGSNNIVLSDGDGNPRMRIDSTGATMFGAVAPNGLGFTVDITPATAYILVNSSASSSAMAYWWYNGTTVGTITRNTTSTSYNTTSDYRLKENIAPMTGALATVAQLKPCTYKWKSDGSNGQGFIAHELQAVVPDAVYGEKDGINKDGNPEYQGVDTSFLVATLTAAIQELKAEVDSLKQQLNGA
jgi:hypothetical protein